jgi:hypothetical protein
MNLVWEEIETGLHRASIPHGWIVQQYDQRYNEKQERWDLIIVSSFFVPDKTHSWNITDNGEANA